MSTPEIQIPISPRAALLSQIHMGVIITLLCLTSIPFFTRLYLRLRPAYRLDAADYFIILGFCLTITDYIFLQSEIFPTPRTISLPVATNAMKLSYLAIPVWGASMTCIKLSVALTLLRIPVNRTWVAFLYIITALQAAYFIGNTVYAFLVCQPLAAIWDFSLLPTAKCLGANTSRIASNVGSAVNITTDVTLSLAPMVVLWKLHRPLRERVLVCGLMALGLLASTACIVKAVIVREWDDQRTDSWALAVSIATWTMAEQILAVMAACGPSLKGPLERVLGRWGVSISSGEVGFVRGREGGGIEKDTVVERAVEGPVYFQAGESAGRSEETVQKGGVRETREQLDVV
ncbi:hypothetical protein OQA88_13365 [Cercophora sp. LCS_1]